MNRSGLIITLTALLVGGVLGYLIHPTVEIIEIDVTKYEYENEIQRLEYEAKISKLENRQLKTLHFIENADSTEVDSLWNMFDF